MKQKEEEKEGRLAPRRRERLTLVTRAIYPIRIRRELPNATMTRTRTTAAAAASPNTRGHGSFRRLLSSIIKRLPTSAPRASLGLSLSSSTARFVRHGSRIGRFCARLQVGGLQMQKGFGKWRLPVRTSLGNVFSGYGSGISICFECNWNETMGWLSFLLGNLGKGLFWLCKLCSTVVCDRVKNKLNY